MKELFNQTICMAAKEHAICEWPHESCGIVQGGIYHPCKNIHHDSTEMFEIDPAIYLDFLLQGTVEAIIHSHNSHPHASKIDMKSQMRTAVPWGIINMVDGIAVDMFFWGDSLPIQTLEGRPFHHGTYDCYGLYRDAYRLELGITLPVFPREYGFWLDEGEDLIVNNLSEAGFKELSHDEALRPYDGILMRLGRTKYVNHVALYIGNDLILHHLYDRKSLKQPISIYKDQIVGVVRHEEM